MSNRCSVEFEAMDRTDCLLSGQGTDVYIFLDHFLIEQQARIERDLAFRQ